MRRKWSMAVAYLMLPVWLAGCGDDINVSVPVIGLSDLEMPITESYVDQEGQEDTGQEGTEQKNSGQEGTGEKGSGQEGTGQAASGAGSQASTEDETVTITISAAGDVTLGNHQEQDYYYSFRQAYDQAEGQGYFFDNVKDIFGEDDMTIVNLEGVLSFSENMAEGLTYNIKGDPDYAYLLNDGNIEAVSMGNNHRLDYGEEGSRDTVAAVEKAGVIYAFDKYTGIYETKGIRIGYVSVNEVYWGAGVEKDIQAGIEKLKEEGVDLILACCHWGTERENLPEDYQKSLGRKCIDWGADLVIGHHPHVLQGAELYEGKFIVYSLGNFCFGANRNPADKDTMIFQQTFTFVNGVKQDDQDARIIPCSVSSVPTRNDFKPTPAEGEEAKRIIGRVNEMSTDFAVKFGEDGAYIP